MIDRSHLIALELLRKEAASGAVAKTLGAGVKGFFGLGKKMSEAAAKAGIKSPTAHFLMKYSPHLATLYGAKKVYESPTGQKARYKVQLWRARRAQRRGY